jgi:hypothetical protein
MGTVDQATRILGVHAGENVGYGTVNNLSGGAFILTNYSWGNGSTPKVGAVTYCSNIAACQNTTVNINNSLVGEQDKSGDGGNFLSPLVLSNGAYLVGGYSWNNGSAEQAGRSPVPSTAAKIWSSLLPTAW